MCYGQLLERGLRVARKVHRCAVCRHPIQPGTQYERQVSVDAGEFSTWQAHAACLARLVAAEALTRPGECNHVDQRETLSEAARELGWRRFRKQAGEALERILQRSSKRTP